jgi:hypothetical protein
MLGDYGAAAQTLDELSAAIIVDGAIVPLGGATMSSPNQTGDD